jgi:two-component system CheB/CheR fusion protein
VPPNQRFVELERELQQARDDVQSTREEMQTSQEELKSTNEELQSTNEELQSTNEELTTSKEEMQSMNEELQTVNQELQSKVDDLARSNNDMRNLLNSTDVATLFLDSDLLVRRFTTQTTKIIKLIPSDAGRPITDIASELDYPDLAEDGREVLRTLVFKEKQVSARDGRWFSVRIMPYRTLENVIDGLVITFSDSTASKLLETALREQASQLRQLTESLPNLVWGCRPDGSCDYLSHQWLEYTGVNEQEQLGFAWLDRLHPEDRDRARDEWKAAVRSGTSLNTELRIRSEDGSYRWFKSRSVPIRDGHGVLVKWYGTHTDVDDLKMAASVKENAATKLASILKWTSDAALVLDHDLVMVYCNEAVEVVLGKRPGELVGRGLFDAFPEAVGTPFETALRDLRRGDFASSPQHLSLGKAAVSVVHPEMRGGFTLLLRPAQEGSGKKRQ